MGDVKDALGLDLLKMQHLLIGGFYLNILLDVARFIRWLRKEELLL